MFANFGIAGVFGGTIIGAVLAKLTKKKTATSNIAIARYYAHFYILLNLVRTEISGVTRMIVYSELLIWGFMTIYKNIRRK